MKFLPNGGQPLADDAIPAQLRKGSSAFHPDYRGIRAPARAFYSLPGMHPAFREPPLQKTAPRLRHAKPP